MFRHCRVLLPIILLTNAAGCTSEEFRQWAAPVGTTKNAPVLTPDKLPKASLEAASRVDSLGGQILAANREITIRPAFLTIGVPELSLFHRGTTQIFISEGLVNKCKSDAELSAVLCAELGKMVSESQLSGPVINTNDPPYAPRVGSDSVGGNGDPDMTRAAERAKWQEKNPRSTGGAILAAADPTELSKQYLGKTGYNPDELLRVAPLIRQAESNPNFEKNLLGGR